MVQAWRGCTSQVPPPWVAPALHLHPQEEHPTWEAPAHHTQPAAWIPPQWDLCRLGRGPHPGARGRCCRASATSPAPPCTTARARVRVWSGALWATWRWTPHAASCECNPTVTMSPELPTICTPEVLYWCSRRTATCCLSRPGALVTSCNTEGLLQLEHAA